MTDEGTKTRQTPAAVHEAAAARLAAGEAEAAWAMLEPALERWPGHSRLRLLAGEVLAGRGDVAAAAAHYAGLLKDEALKTWALPRLMKLLASARLALPGALGVAERALEAGLDPAALAPLLDALSTTLEETDRTAFLEAVAPRAGIFRLEWKLAVALTEQGEIERALRLLETAGAAGRTSEQGELLRAELLFVCGRTKEAVLRLEANVRARPDHPDSHRRLIAMLQQAALHDQAGQVMQHAAERWPGDWMLLFRLNRLPLAPGRLASVFAAFEAGADAAAAADERYRMFFAIACLHQGLTRRAEGLLDHPFKPPLTEMAADILGALRARTADAWRAGSRLADDRTADVQITRAENARATVILPTGISFGYLPLGFIDALLAEQGVNAVYLRDFRKRAYLRGVVSLGADEAETIAALKRLAAELGAPRTLVLGSSSGGFSALRIGALMGADAAVSFSGPTHLGEVYGEHRPSIWNPAFFVRQTLAREAALPQDLRPALAGAPGVRVIQLHGADAPEDARHAARIADLPNVEVRPVAGVSAHAVVDHMIATGAFGKLVAELLGDCFELAWREASACAEGPANS